MAPTIIIFARHTHAEPTILSEGTANKPNEAIGKHTIVRDFVITQL